MDAKAAKTLICPTLEITGVAVSSNKITNKVARHHKTCRS